MIKSPLNNAKALIHSGDEEKLVYACLELRLAIESYVYRKLEFHSKRHGKKLLYKHWQPNKAIKILDQIEPKANLSYQLSFAKQTGEDVKKLDYKPLGFHHALSVSWINKTYNKLGSFLHLQPKSNSMATIDKTFLEEVVVEIEKSETSSLLSNFATTISFDCDLCKESITCCEEALTDLKEVVCPNDLCRGAYDMSKEGTDWMFKLKTLSFDCPDCNSKSELATTKLDVGQRIVCIDCGSQFQIAGNEWKLSKVIN